MLKRVQHDGIIAFRTITQATRNGSTADYERTIDPVFLSAFGQGACYGEQGMVYGTMRSASVIADGKAGPVDERLLMHWVRPECGP